MVFDVILMDDKPQYRKSTRQLALLALQAFVKGCRGHPTPRFRDNNIGKSLK